MIKLEVGKSYKTRGGWKATVITFKENDRYVGNRVYAKHESDGKRFELTHDIEGGKWTYSSKPDAFDLIAEWEDEVDLTKIEKPFGLLDKETQERLKAHGGPYEWHHQHGWGDCHTPLWFGDLTYRVKPKPVVEYKKTGWVNSKHTGFGYEITEKFVDGKYDSYTVDMVPF